MSRSRNIKPGFFLNDRLGALPPLARLMFAGLWTVCDREGRILDRPIRIKVEILPYDDCDPDHLLNSLHEAGFIDRYEADGLRLIQVCAWDKHQNPHVKEQPSILPCKCKHQTSTVQAPDKHQTSTVQVPEKVIPCPEHAGLIPSSLIPSSLIPSSLIPSSLIPSECIMLSHDRPRPTADDPPDPATSPLNGTEQHLQATPDCPHLAILALWAEVLPQLPQHDPTQWGNSRAIHLRQRWRETAALKHWPDEAHGIEYFRKLFAYIAQSQFLTGRIKPRNANSHAFMIELEWLVKPNNWSKVIEGKYHQD